MQEYDIVIAGAGMTGLALALSLAQTNWNICILERDTQVPVFNAEEYAHRVSALNASSENLLKKVGAWQDIEQMRISPYFSMYVWDAQSVGEIEFNANEVGAENLGHIIENEVVVLGLSNRLADHKNIDLQRGKFIESMRVEGNKRKLVLNSGEIISTNLVVGCDGANSGIRDMAGINMLTWDYGHTGIVASITTEKPHNFTAMQRFSRDKILAFLPLNQPNLLSIVFSMPHDKAQKVLQMDEVDFCNYLTEESESKLGKVVGASARYSFAFRQRNVKEYAKRGLVLVGDAAHTIHPLAGQGVNQGFLDVIVLAEELLKAGENGEDIGDIGVLRRYQMRRMPDNLFMMASMEIFKRGFNNDSTLLAWFRNKVLDFTNSQAFLKKLIIGQASGEARINNVILKKVAQFWRAYK